MTGNQPETLSILELPPIEQPTQDRISCCRTIPVGLEDGGVIVAEMSIEV